MTAPDSIVSQSASYTGTATTQCIFIRRRMMNGTPIENPLKPKRYKISICRRIDLHISMVHKENGEAGRNRWVYSGPEQRRES